jgi:hypothetical protein
MADVEMKDAPPAGKQAKAGESSEKKPRFEVKKVLKSLGFLSKNLQKRS